jgi:hypothetical protein
MDAVTDPSVKMISVMKSARIGYTRCLDNIVCYFIHHDPAPLLIVQPREGNGSILSVPAGFGNFAYRRVGVRPRGRTVGA